MEESFENDDFLKSVEAQEIGSRVHHMHSKLGILSDPKVWEEFGSNISLDTIAAFMITRKIELERAQYEPTTTASPDFPRLNEHLMEEKLLELNELKSAVDLSLPDGRRAAREYFQRQMAGAWYGFKTGPEQADSEPSQKIIKHCQTAIKLLEEEPE